MSQFPETAPRSIQSVERFKTLDGKLHGSEENAQDYITDLCCEFLDKRITAIFKDSILGPTHKQKFDLINGLAGSLKGCEEMRDFFASIIE